MAGIITKITVDLNRRLCTVKGENGYFHCWGSYSDPIPASPMIGGSPAGVSAALYGIVEFADRVERVWPEQIVFCDEINQTLQKLGVEEDKNGAKED